MTQIELPFNLYHATRNFRGMSYARCNQEIGTTLDYDMVRNLELGIIISHSSNLLIVSNIKKAISMTKFPNL